MRVLLVEDNIDAAESLAAALELMGQYQVHHVARLSEALAFELQDVDVALVDLGLPDACGTEAALALNAAAPDLPLVVLTATRSEEMALELIRHGIQDFLLKGDVTLQRIDHAINFARERKHKEIELRRNAVRDPLTGLFNRAEFERELRKAISHAERQGTKAAVLLIDLDDFKQVNDTRGHAAGDGVLRQVAMRLAQLVRTGDTLARYGGDEFIMVVEGIRTEQDAAAVAAKIIEALREPFHVDGQMLGIGTSIGIAICPDHAGKPAPLIQLADTALYAAKGRGKNRYHLHGFEEPPAPVQPSADILQR